VHRSIASASPRLRRWRRSGIPPARPPASGPAG